MTACTVFRAYDLDSVRTDKMVRADPRLFPLTIEEAHDLAGIVTAATVRRTGKAPALRDVTRMIERVMGRRFEDCSPDLFKAASRSRRQALLAAGLRERSRSSQARLRIAKRKAERRQRFAQQEAA